MAPPSPFLPGSHRHSTPEPGSRLFRWGRCSDRAAEAGGSLSGDQLSEATLTHVRALAEIAKARGQSLAQMALSWALRDERVTSVLIGASSVAQLEENLAAAGRSSFSDEELAAIDQDAVDAGINIWARSSAQ